MADFAENMRALFGFDPTRGQMLTGPAPIGARVPQTQGGMDQAQATAAVTGRPMSPEATDPTTPSPMGRVLARLRTPGASTPKPAAVPSGVIGDGFGSDLAAGIAAGKPGMDRGSAFLAGFAGAAKNIEARRAAAAKAAMESKKANLDLLKSIFEMQGKIEDRQNTAAKDAASSARQNRQDAETKRWHDIMAPAYSKSGKDGDNKELSPKDAILAEQRLREMSGYNPSDENWQYLKPEEQQRRQTIFQRLYERHFGRPYEIGGDGLPVIGKKPAATPPAAAVPGVAPPIAASSTDGGDEEDDAPKAKKPAAPPPAGAKPPAAAPTQTTPPAAATPAAPAAPQVWRKYQSTDGTVKLFNPATGESKSLEPDAMDAGPAPSIQDYGGQGGN